MASEPGGLAGLLVDFGGVLTTDVFASFEAFCVAEGLPPATVRDLFRDDPEARGLLADLETGALAEGPFAARFAARLGVEPDGLVERLFAGAEENGAMVAAVRAARRGGVRTGLLSNSWGTALYDRETFPELFDAHVISGDVGMRKPDPRIYALAAERMGLAAAQVVYVDDLRGNLKPARALGMTTVHHRDASETVPELERLLGMSLR
jgi:putative hydrolase of the HAD superfamily